ncbi:MAG: TolC family protein [Oligoflexales bacterium]
MKFIIMVFFLTLSQPCLCGKHQWSLQELFDIALGSSHQKHLNQGAENEITLLNRDLHKKFSSDLSHEIFYEKNENQSIGLYDPGERQKIGMNHTVKKKFSTGTSLTSNLSVVDSSARSNHLKTRGVEASLEIKIEQDLLKNKWGKEYELSRAKNEFVSQQKKLEQIKIQHDLFMDILHAATLVEQKKLSYEAAYEALQRDDDLAEIYRKKSQDGMISTEETLQIDSQLLQDRNDLEVRKLELVSAWSALSLRIYTDIIKGEDVAGLYLNLPSPSIDFKICSIQYPLLYENHPEYRIVSSKVQKSQIEMEIIRESLRAESKFSVASRFNHVDSHAGGALSQLGHPRWQVNLSLQYHFESPEQNSLYRRKVYEKKSLEIQQEILKQKISSEKEILCHTWEQQKNNLQNQKNIVHLAKNFLEKNQLSYRNGVLSFAALSAAEKSYIQKKEALGLLALQMKKTQWKMLYALGLDLRDGKANYTG